MRGTIRTVAAVVVVVVAVGYLWPTVEVVDGPNGEPCFTLKNNSTFNGKLMCQDEAGQFYEYTIPTGGK